MSPEHRAPRRLLARPLTWLVITLVVVVVAVGALLIGGRIYADHQNGTAAEAFTATTTSTTEETVAAASAGEIAGTWTVTEGSEAGYRVEEVLNGQDVTVVGRTEDTSGEITIEDTTLTEGAVAVDLTTVATDEQNRDDYFRTEAVDTATHPEATFTLADDVDLAALAEDGTATVTVPGTLAINGEEQEVEVELTLTRTEDGLTVVGASDVNWADYGVEAPSLGFVTVEDAGQIEFSLVLAAA